MNNISGTSIIHPGVKLGSNITIEDYCVIGVPAKSMVDEVPPTIIGDGAYIRSFTVLYAGNVIGKNFSSGNKANIREFNTIGDNVSIGTLSIVEHHVIIEDEVRIHSQAFIPEFSTLKKGAWIGPQVVLTNARYPLSRNSKKELLGPTLEEHSKVGASSTILPGVVIGAHALVGAGSTVTKDVPKNAVVVGNPARCIREIVEHDY